MYGLNDVGTVAGALEALTEMDERENSRNAGFDNPIGALLTLARNTLVAASRHVSCCASMPYVVKRYDDHLHARPPPMQLAKPQDSTFHNS